MATPGAAKVNSIVYQVLRHHYDRRQTSQLTRTLNLLTRQAKQNAGTLSFDPTLGYLADLAAAELTGQLRIQGYGPVAQAAATRFFSDSDDSRFQADNCPPRLETDLTTGVYSPTPQFQKLPQHAAVLKTSTQELVALTGPAGDPQSEAAAQLFAAAPLLLDACRLALADYQNDPSPTPTQQAVLAALRQAIAAAANGGTKKIPVSYDLTGAGQGVDSPSRSNNSIAHSTGVDNASHHANQGFPVLIFIGKDNIKY